VAALAVPDAGSAGVAASTPPHAADARAVLDTSSAGARPTPVAMRAVLREEQGWSPKAATVVREVLGASWPDTASEPMRMTWLWLRLRARRLCPQWQGRAHGVHGDEDRLLDRERIKRRIQIG
jgi:hypothetical protein